MSSRQSPKSNKNQSTARPNGDHIDQIRELIFGEQMSGYEERFAALEEKLTSEINVLRERVETNLADLKALMKSRTNEVETLSVSRQNLADSLEKLAQSLR